MIAYVIYDVDGKKLELSRDLETNCLRMGVGEESCYIPYDELKQLASFINQIAIELDEHKKATTKAACTGNCGLNYCDENGCINRKRDPADDIALPSQAESKGEPFPETIRLSDVPPAIKGGANG